jgi:hypothetical protein
MIAKVQQSKKIRQILLFSSVLCITLLLCGCASFFSFPSYYDATTFKNLTDIKPEVLVLYDTFATDSPDTAAIGMIRLKLSQMIEYEKGKGSKNVETAKQIELIKVMFERQVEDRLNGAKWNEADLENNKENVGEALDIAIATENLKNKNK